MKSEHCWLYKYGCPCRTASCWGLPDEGCPVYIWFKKFILDREKESIAEKVQFLLVEEGQKDPKFHLSETIKYSPSEVRDIIKKHINEL